MKNKKFSIITINLNNLEGLKLTFESVINQTYKDFEFIIIDGGSSDGSLKFIEENKSYIDYYQSKTDEGRYDAMNQGLEHSNGDYILFLNSGDYLVSENILEKIDSLNLNTNEIYYGNILINNEDGHSKSQVNMSNIKLGIEFFLDYALPHQATFFPRKIFQQIGNYDKNFVIHGDHEFYVRAFKSNINISHFDLDVSIYDLNGISGNKKFEKLSNKEKQIIFQKYFNYPKINFFTIVLNGMPFIEYHINVFNKLKFDWHWHIVEGAALLKHDTSWSVNFGGKLNNSFHKNGLSIDGTTVYLDELQKKYPNNITIYRKTNGKLWDGKIEMIKAPLENINYSCLLWQIDADELWTIEQINRVRSIFQENSKKTAAYFLCDFFVGENLILDNLNKYANNFNQDWLRVWNFKPGMKWSSHEPPILINNLNENIAHINPFTHFETEVNGLIFQHYAYTTEQQIKFKEEYYGMKNAYKNWIDLNNTTNFPVLAKDYLEWIHDDCKVITTNHVRLNKIAQKNDEKWIFDYSPKPLKISSRFSIDLMNLIMENINELKLKFNNAQQIIYEYEILNNNIINSSNIQNRIILSKSENLILNFYRNFRRILFPYNSNRNKIIRFILKPIYKIFIKFKTK